MAGCLTTNHPYEGLAQNTASDRERARELYKYFRPPISSEPLDTVLTAHAQLVAWRLNAERSMISLIDEETQYFVAESTKTVHLDDAAQYDDPEDAIWAGCVRVPKAGRLCEHTVAALPPPEGGPAYFEVLDLSKDTRFNQLNFIAGPPHFRYYAGVPLRTHRGINIGSIYILDSKLRPALTRNERNFLGIMADNVIQHLEMTRDKNDRQRTFRMNECLSMYVDPASEDVRRWSSGRRSESSDDESDDSQGTADGFERIEVITRAAGLLREAMDIEEDGGGVLFLDTSLAAVPTQQQRIGNMSGSEAATAKALDGSNSGATTRPNTRSSSPEVRRKRTNTTEILAHTYTSVDVSPDQPEFLPFTPEELAKLSKRYPRGKMFTYDQRGQELSDSSENGSVVTARPKSRKHRQMSPAESASLHAHFPKARQIIFIPLWDSTTSRSAACFVYNCSDYRNFSHQLEFLNCITFCSCVDTELMRLANLKANEQKDDFIGSISHELRSPLHGILASCEFLQDTTCTSFQQSLVDTAESCARTLLDTVNMVLDYSKINAFEKNKTGDGLQSDTRPEVPETLQTNLSTHRNVNLAVLTEEVVEGVAAGHAFNARQTQSLRNETGTCGRKLSVHTDLTLCNPDVEVIVDISKQDWTYWCEPGGMRRIIMNLVGNSLKYTRAGYVHVELATEIGEPDATEYGVLTVKDSGQGMSPAYLKDKLFAPFVQESNQAPGIGLGLSLVKSIVDTLGGHIAIESTVGVGTKATVKIPLRRDTRITPGINSMIPNCSDNDADDIDDSSIVQTIATRAIGKSIALYCHEERAPASGRDEASRLMRQSITAYLEAWCGFSVSRWHQNSTADIVVIEEANLDALLHDSPQLSIPGSRTKILVLRNISSIQSADVHSIKNSNVEDVRHPLGPHKLARALLSCLDRSHVKVVETDRNDSPCDVTIRLIEETTAAIGDVTILDNESMHDENHTVKHDSLNPENDKLRAQTITHFTDNGLQPNINNDLLGRADHRNTILANTRSNSSPGKISSTDEKKIPSTTKPLSNTATLKPSTSINTAFLSHTQRVLLVEDNTINLRLLQVGMKKRGYTAISSAENGLQAVNTYRSLLHAVPPSPPDIILMDLSMPIMTGFEATRQIRELEAEYNGALQEGQAPRHSLIVALTGLASVRDQKDSFTSGVDSYIMKPVSFAKLTTLLQDWTVEGNGGTVREVPGVAVVVG
ncbi:uncharacterized protein EKO05_0003027 [Ascochyta rabiei]|uniref:Phosphorelay sensor kinase n=1 Tax=Didymella rabiei TaxID=5454 RepID=A0A162XDP7_DIDRA|nr:uncharacterized protein EKO05_0003027 [Ascochyta rabiei]KZM19489.1 phosphorelay sensor kinase [Ascochyta rabiei]UPX12481.1 hypothetical protein EKO05_0003027 [Ascochyta rabiei]